ncbi:unnamed protein product [Gulo gulo]|uniref:Uncharacterized protein n=1 Tax=Gulo gulo TaxID=48420 RepID=A0A9X9MCU9_GULGU|nr:unnamed protein product [Gulo gulo]
MEVSQAAADLKQFCL